MLAVSVVAVAAAAGLGCGASADDGAQRAAATCDAHPNQAAAQRAKDTTDGDGDGIYCETLPCPCARPGERAGAEVARGGGEPRRTIRAQITDVVDGDTIDVRAGGRDYRVRLIGIDTPETKKPGTQVECGGEAATSNLLRLAFTAPADSDGDGLLDAEGGTGRRVTLRTDPTQDTFDRYRRLLAYATTPGGEDLAVGQLSAGWATVYVFERPFRRLSRFRAGEREARDRSRGVWRECGGNFHAPAPHPSR
jgi:micrococcal nuclease